MTAYQGLNNSLIFDFETLSTDRVNGVVVSMAMLPFSDTRFTSPGMKYTYQELIDSTVMIKFDVEDQVKNWNRKIDPKTLQWWSEQGPEAAKQLKPTPDDKSISELFDFWVLNKPVNLKKVYSRGNTFDPIILDYILEQTGYPSTSAYAFHMCRDTRSIIDGLAWGSDIKNSFIPEGLEKAFVAHDPRHDIAMDVMRMQYLVNLLYDDEIPF